VSTAPAARLALAAALVLAATGAAGCGGDDDPSAGGSGGATAATAGGGGPPADEAAVRTALGRTKAAHDAARTAKLERTQRDDEGEVSTTGTGVIDLAGKRVLLRETSVAPQKQVADTWTEPGKYGYIRADPDAGDAFWNSIVRETVSAGPADLLPRLGETRVTKVAGTSGSGDDACRTFEGTIPAVDPALGVDDPEYREGATLPVTGCVGGDGRVHALTVELDTGRLLKPRKDGFRRRTVNEYRLSDFGSATVERPDGLEDAVPLGSPPPGKSSDD